MISWSPVRGWETPQFPVQPGLQVPRAVAGRPGAQRLLRAAAGWGEVDHPAGCYGLNCLPQNNMWKSSPPAPQNMVLFGNRVLPMWLAEVWSGCSGEGPSLSRRAFPQEETQAQTQREHLVETGGGRDLWPLEAGRGEEASLRSSGCLALHSPRFWPFGLVPVR